MSGSMKLLVRIRSTNTADTPSTNPSPVSLSTPVRPDAKSGCEGMINH